MITLNRAGRISSFAVIASLLVLTAACGTPSGTGTSSSSSSSAAITTAKAPGTLYSSQNVGDAQWVKTLDPATVTDSISISDINMVNANLVKAIYPSLKIGPDLASHWTVSADHKTWTFYLRPNAKFSNGDPVTAEDAAWSITRSLLPATKSPVATTYLGDIVGAADVAGKKATTVKGMKVINAHTLQITLDKPIAYFLGTLSYPTADVLDKKVMQGKAPVSYLTNDCAGNIGAGPFKFVCLNTANSLHSFYPGGHSPFMKFVPNPNYYGAKPHITVIAPFYATLDDGWHAFEAGQLDYAGVPTADLTTARKMAGFSESPILETDYITPNSKLAPFTNVHCRLAVAYAIDRVSITTKLLHGTEGPLYDVVPPGLQGYFSNPQANGVPYYNPTRAKSELASCPGHLSGVTMAYQSTGSSITHEYDAVKANLAAVGANITLKPLTFNAWLNVVGQTMQATHTQITENLWIDDYPDAQDWMQNLLYTGANYNIGGYNNPQFDKLVDAGNTEFNNAKRAQDYMQAEKLVLNDGGWIGVGYGFNPVVINPKRVTGLVNSPSLVQPNNNNWSQVSVM